MRGLVWTETACKINALPNWQRYSTSNPVLIKLLKRKTRGREAMHGHKHASEKENISLTRTKRDAITSCYIGRSSRMYNSKRQSVHRPPLNITNRTN
ncbi:hypothetical protein GUJ93_ZPchr0006g46308 [Zizania palustris]|uniref:Uncharacterized protein n=1 Tax=Zizania palustris TaxID=103762 RepID=A0A8J5SDM3_ZIZPA|nr:hypothetical protein GUJ93_ZPchr0006g46308 [Zizania palustris]